MPKQNFNEKLIALLKTNPDFLDESDELLPAAVKDHAWQLDHTLIRLLLSDPEIKSTFFDEIDGHWVFNHNTFIDYINEKNFLANSYTQFRNKIGLNIDGKFFRERGEVSLVWPYKDCILEGGQTTDEEKRKEIFFNEILAQDEINQMFDPKVLTSWKRYTAAGAQDVTEIKRDDNDTIRENLIIKGNNLIALHTLKQQFRGQVKLIYIDPPYNTGGSTDSFSYNNEFKHSTWLTFIRNRIEIGKELLKNDGFMAVTIDHVELFYLGVLLDEIFGRENRIGIVTIYINPKGRQHERFFSAATEHMLVYAKDISKAKFNKVALDKDKIESFDKRDEEGNYRLEQFIRVRSNTSRTNKPKFWYPIYVSKDLKDITLTKKDDYHEVLPINNGREFTWKTKPETFEKRNVGDYFVAVEQHGQITILHKYREQQVIKNLWTDKKYFPEFQGTNLLKNLLGKNLFSYPKSLYAVLDTLKIMTGNDDIILDFFAGSGTTAHAVLESNTQDNGNRKFILVEQMDYVENVTVPRVEKVIGKQGGDFIYCEPMQYNQAYMDKIQAAQSSKELVALWQDIAENSFLNWYVNAEMPQDAVDDFIAIDDVEKQKHLLAELLDKNQLYVNLSEIEDADFEISEGDKGLNRKFYT
ncbi:MAG: site-specific DNA-methyltransferase [Candidatus Poribacteria bacterium]|nr:site-specific DNA-methyltransferase [Candidatus Poribacteria bacterium]